MSFLQKTDILIISLKKQNQYKQLNSIYSSGLSFVQLIYIGISERKLRLFLECVSYLCKVNVKYPWINMLLSI